MNRIRIANAPCSWGTLEFEGMKGERILCGQMLDELRDTGYKGTELGDWGFMPTDPNALASELRSRGLSLVGAFVPVALKFEAAHDAGVSEAVKIGRLLASAASILAQEKPLPFIVLADANVTNEGRTLNAGRVAPEMGLSPEEWAVFARGAEKVARAVRSECGLATVFHHHCAGYVETPDEIGRLMSMTDPSLLGLVFDTGHYMYGTGANDGAAVTAGLERFADRIWHVHFKDCDPLVASAARANGWEYLRAIRQGIFCELGRGGVPFEAVTAWLRARNYADWIVVEQDVLPGMGAPRESARRNREYLQSIGL
jgi:inosose dehydratase